MFISVYIMYYVHLYIYIYVGNNEKWDKIVKRYIIKWVDHIDDWLKPSKRLVLVVQYENLRKNLDGELRRMLDFLEHPYNEEDIQCTVHSAMDGFHRNHTRNFDPYTPSQKQFVLQQLRKVRNTLRIYNIDYF